MTKEQFFQISTQFLNIPYIWGGYSPLKGLDCSGLAQELLKILGIDPPGDQTAAALMDFFIKYNAGVSATDIGSLAFYGKEKPTHVAMFISPTHVIEAGGGDSKTINFMNAVDRDARVRIRHFKHRNDLLACIRPQGLPGD